MNNYDVQISRKTFEAAAARAAEVKLWAAVWVGLGLLALFAGIQLYV